MLEKTITYENPFTDEEVTERHFFHISKADMVEMEMEEHSEKYTTKNGRELTGMEAKLHKIVEAEDGKTLMATLKDIIRRSYGKKVGDRFVKNKDSWEEFESSEAFSQLLFELCTDAGKAAEFTNGLFPKNLDRDVSKIPTPSTPSTSVLEPAPVSVPETTNGPVVDGLTSDRQKAINEATPENPVTIADDELRFVSSTQLKTGLASGAIQL